ncbi:MAG: hypothetical protein R2751_07355 [Bacteroidales bacterium]
MELCHALLRDTGIAMLPGYEFGRQPDELTARIALVDFDGARALQAASIDYLTSDLDDAFVENFAPRLHQAFVRMQEWFGTL